MVALPKRLLVALYYLDFVVWLIAAISLTADLGMAGPSCI